MDKNFKLSESRKHLVSSIKIVLISMLAIIEIIVCAQYATQYIEKGRTGDLIAVIISCVLLVT